MIRKKLIQNSIRKNAKLFFPSLPVSIPSKRVGSVSSIFQILHIAMYDTEKWNISCHISKQRMSSVLAALQHELVNPKETQERKNTCHVAAIRLKPLPIMSLEETQDVTRQGLAPDTWGAYQENDFSQPRLLHHPTYRKALNSLTWGIWFSIINSNIWHSDYLPFVAKLLYIMAPPFVSSEQFFQGYLRCCLPDLKC